MDKKRKNLSVFIVLSLVSGIYLLSLGNTKNKTKDVPHKIVKEVEVANTEKLSQGLFTLEKLINDKIILLQTRKVLYRKELKEILNKYIASKPLDVVANNYKIVNAKLDSMRQRVLRGGLVRSEKNITVASIDEISRQYASYAAIPLKVMVKKELIPEMKTQVRKTERSSGIAAWVSLCAMIGMLSIILAVGYKRFKLATKIKDFKLGTRTKEELDSYGKILKDAEEKVKKTVYKKDQEVIVTKSEEKPTEQELVHLANGSLESDEFISRLSMICQSLGVSIKNINNYADDFSSISTIKRNNAVKMLKNTVRYLKEGGVSNVELNTSTIKDNLIVEIKVDEFNLKTRLDICRETKETQKFLRNCDLFEKRAKGQIMMNLIKQEDKTASVIHARV
jgi:hypothetical protein